MLPDLATQTIIRWRSGAAVEDDYHNPIPGNPTALTITGCSVQPGDGREYVIDRSATTTLYTVWAPPDADIQDNDRIEFAGTTYDIEGPVERWVVGMPLDHLLIRLTRTGG